MAHQDNPLTACGFGPKRWQRTVLLGGENGLHISQAQGQGFGAWRRCKAK
jgi:hypothetical protein